MKVVCDSSGCCAIKHIRDFYHCPRPADPYYVKVVPGHDEDQYSTSPDACQPWEMIEEAKNCTAGEHLRWLVSHIQSRRPAGMITVNLVADFQANESYCCESCDGDYDKWVERHEQCEFDSSVVDAWRPLLEELGFKEQTFINSNSNNRIHHFTLIYNMED